MFIEQIQKRSKFNLFRGYGEVYLSLLLFLFLPFYQFQQYNLYVQVIIIILFLRVFCLLPSSPMILYFVVMGHYTLRCDKRHCHNYFVKWLVRWKLAFVNLYCCRFDVVSHTSISIVLPKTHKNYSIINISESFIMMRYGLSQL